jgi:shikimate kinase
MGNIFLVGFMGTGKTAVGRALAERLGRPFLDLDAEIERLAGASVAEIFARFGEAGFRAREREALERLGELDGAVVATGGGIVLDPRNRATMRARGTVICLTANLDTILRRVGQAADRPLLAGATDPAERAGTLLAERAAAYAEADWTVDTSHLAVADVVESIARRLATLEDAATARRGALGTQVG